jgi:GNAT superfamily N-acetyltransferase
VKAATNAAPSELAIQPVTADRWPDMAALFGPRGASSGCWCMWFRVAPKDYWAGRDAPNQAAMAALVAADRMPGMLAYDGDEAVGWVSVAPRDEFTRIAGAAGAAGAEAEEGVWSIVCFFVRPGHRGQRIAAALLEGAVEHARAAGARVLEAYPLESEGKISNASAYTGMRSMFEAAGFVEGGRFDRWQAVPAATGDEPKPLVRPPGRPVMRLVLETATDR